MKKILWMHSHFNYWMGGTKLIFQLTSKLNEHIPVKVLVEDYGEEARANYAGENIELIKTTGITSTSPWYWLILPHYVRKNQEIASRHIDSDTILVSSMFPMNAVMSAFPNRKLQYMFEPFAFIHDELMINGMPLAKRLFCRYVRWRYAKLDIAATRAAHKVFTLNDVTAGTIREIYQLDAIPTYTGIDTEFFRPIDSPDLRDKYRGRRVLIHSTDFSPIKGTDLALKALALVKKRYPNVLLLVTTTIQDEKGIAQMWELADKLGIRPNIEFLGFVPYQELPRYYSFSEILLQTGIGAKAGATSFSLPAKEALACATPVIRHPITTEDVEHEVSGLLIDASDSARYADGICQLLEHPERSRLMGRKGREKIVATFNWHSVIQTLLRTITEN